MGWQNKKYGIRACNKCGKIYKWDTCDLCRLCRTLNDIEQRQDNRNVGKAPSDS